MKNKLHRYAKEGAELILIVLNETVGQGRGCGVIVGDVHPEGYMKMWDSQSEKRLGCGAVRGAGNHNGAGVG